VQYHYLPKDDVCSRGLLPQSCSLVSLSFHENVSEVV
jgi:hypothetical protein